MNYNAVTINFIYNNCSFDLYNDYEIKKLTIINKNTHHYEFFYENHEEILINKCKLKNVSFDEMSDLLKQLYLCIINNFKSQ
jgi:ASC-1-like (ASCH) protein